MRLAQRSRINLLESPLSQLLTAFEVELDDSPITDAGFFGAFVERRDGTRLLSMPIGRPEFERDTAARLLLAEGPGLDAPPVPAQLTVSRV